MTFLFFMMLILKLSQTGYRYKTCSRTTYFKCTFWNICYRKTLLILSIITPGHFNVMDMFITTVYCDKTLKPFPVTLS